MIPNQAGGSDHRATHGNPKMRIHAGNGKSNHGRYDAGKSVKDKGTLSESPR